MSTAAEPTPRTLAYLAQIGVERLKGVGAVSLRKLQEQGIHSVADLLLTAPNRYLDPTELAGIAAAAAGGEEVTVGCSVESFAKRRISRGRTMVEARVTDRESSMRVVWFNPYMKLTVGDEIALTGKIEMYRGSFQMKSPAVDKLGESGLVEARGVVPVYGSLGGIKPKTVQTMFENAVARSVPLVDIVPFDDLDRLDLVDRSFAIENLHFPSTIRDANPARRRLAFDEFLRIQMALRVREHDDFETKAGVANSVRGPLFHRYIDNLPFQLTVDQETSLEKILLEMESPRPLHRLLQGEVGSGKTVVVIAALLTSVESGHQGAVMAPTEVLATQHYLGTVRSLQEAGMAPTASPLEATGTGSLFAEESLATRPVRVGLFTGSGITVNFVSGDVPRPQGAEWLADGTIDIAFGTHALIQEGIRFRSLGITVVDEQHRFGVEQRSHLRDTENVEGVPDLLLMTATPIPRTLLTALYGGLDVSTISTMPPGRSPTLTEWIPAVDDEVSPIDDAIRTVVAEGQQVFVVCPLVEDSDKIDARSAESEYRRLSKELSGLRVAMLHGQMASDAKADIMERYRVGDIDVLVATTVIEVGIDVPNATLMVIWNAERFGLSQLHQLRGRVGRGPVPARCILVTNDVSPDAERRVQAMVDSRDGFELAQVDLEIRGHGTLFGSAQSGVGDLRFGNLLLEDHVKLVESAAELAAAAVATDRDGVFVASVMEEFALFVGDNEDWLTRS